jgi:GTP-binding protein LepA
MEYLGRHEESSSSAAGEARVMLEYRLPLAEMLIDFYDPLKSRTQGYASLDYSFSHYAPSKLVKLDILVNGQPVDALSLITPSEKGQQQGRALVERLRRLIPRQMSTLVQAAVGGHIIARETIRAMRKNVLAKCYGGDVTRKRKLLEKQKAGKKRMRMVGQSRYRGLRLRGGPPDRKVATSATDRHCREPTP